jgi:hypothetical protein
MINDYVIKLIENLPDDIKNVNEPIKMDLVLDGGIFNGSYLVGALYFLKEMENRKYIKIERISGCSVGSIVGFLYFIDSLDLMPKLYDLINTEFRQTYNLNLIKELKKHLLDRIPDDICKIINDRLYITYNNIKKNTKPVKKNYKDVDDIINTIIKSSYIPYLIDGNILHENKFIDGITPFIFKERENRILHLDLFGSDKLGNLLNVRNEKTNYHRILSGLLDIHSFFIKKTNTSMCSYINDWTYYNTFYNYIKTLIEKICICLINLLLFVQTKMPREFKDTVLYKILSKISYDIFIILLENYCF